MFRRIVSRKPLMISHVQGSGRNPGSPTGPNRDGILWNSGFANAWMHGIGQQKQNFTTAYFILLPEVPATVVGC